MAEVRGKPGRVLMDFKSLREQNVQAGDTLHHVVYNPTLLQRTGYFLCGRTSRQTSLSRLLIGRGRQCAVHLTLNCFG